MSFGFSALEFMKIIDKTWEVYKACKNASKHHQEILTEVLALHTILQELRDAFGDPKSLINRADDSKKREISKIISGCDRAVQKINDLAVRYSSLGTDKERIWEILGFGTVKLPPLRSQLLLAVANLNLALTSLGTSSLARIETLLERLIKEVRQGRKAPTVLSSAIDDVSIGWPQLKAELIEDGIPSEAIEVYKRPIQEWITKATDDGLFDDPDQERSDSSTQVHLRALSIRAPSISSTSSERRSLTPEPLMETDMPTPMAEETDGDGVFNFSNPRLPRPLSIRVLATSSTASREESTSERGHIENPPDAEMAQPGINILFPADQVVSSVRRPDPSPSKIRPDHMTILALENGEQILKTNAIKHHNVPAASSVSSVKERPRDSLVTANSSEQTWKPNTEGHTSTRAISMTPINSVVEVSEILRSRRLRHQRTTQDTITS